jgi:hypothetical protein
MTAAKLQVYRYSRRTIDADKVNTHELLLDKINTKLLIRCERIQTSDFLLHKMLGVIIACGQRVFLSLRQCTQSEFTTFFGHNLISIRNKKRARRRRSSLSNAWSRIVVVATGTAAVTKNRRQLMQRSSFCRRATGHRILMCALGACAAALSTGIPLVCSGDYARGC